MRHTLRNIAATAVAAGIMTVSFGVLPAFAETAPAAVNSSSVIEQGTVPASLVQHAQTAATPDDTNPNTDSVVKSVTYDGTDSPLGVAIVAALVFIVVGGVSIIGYRRSR